MERMVLVGRRCSDGTCSAPENGVHIYPPVAIRVVCTPGFFSRGDVKSNYYILSSLRIPFILIANIFKAPDIPQLLWSFYEHHCCYFSQVCI